MHRSVADQDKVSVLQAFAEQRVHQQLDTAACHSAPWYRTMRLAAGCRRVANEGPGGLLAVGSGGQL